MSSPPGTHGGCGGHGDTLSGGLNGVAQQYYCYQCERVVSISPSPASSDDLQCPLCNGGFLEEYENSNPNPNPSPSPNPHLDPFPDPLSSFLNGLPFLLSPSSSTDLQNPRDMSTLFPPQPQINPPGGARPQDPRAFNPFLFLQDYLQSMRAGGGGANSNIQFVIENNPSDPGFRLPSNIGDYFVGPGLEQLIQQLAENDPNRHGTPPASKSAVEALPSVSVSDELLSSDLAQCAVCMNDFELGMKVKQMPCNHIYHSDCILPWLELHNSCPVCRYELPTDDPDYENQMQVSRGSGSSNVVSGGGSGGTQESSEAPWSPERRFTISLPWHFSAFGSRAETSEGGVGNNGGSNDGGSDPAGPQNWNSRSETRQGDLD